MKLWIDDVRPAPEGYVWCKSVNIAKNILCKLADTYVVDVYSSNKPYFTTLCHGEKDLNSLREMWPDVRVLEHVDPVELIDIDHDAGDYACDGGDYIKLLDWLEETGRNYPIRIHSANAVGVENMRRIIQGNGWKEVF